MPDKVSIQLPAQTLEELAQELLYQNSVDIYLTLCREKHVTRNTEHYKQFINYLQSEKLPLTRAPLGHTLKDPATRSPMETYTIKLTKETIAAIRQFQPK